MKIKTQDLTGSALDYAVAMAAGAPVMLYKVGPVHDECTLPYTVAGTRYDGKPSPGAAYAPSTDWSKGGPIIERERIEIAYFPDGGHPDGGAWNAITCDEEVECFGPTPLIAAMRCYVATRLGDTVEVPDELAA